MVIDFGETTTKADGGAERRLSRRARTRQASETGILWPNSEDGILSKIGALFRAIDILLRAPAPHLPHPKEWYSILSILGDI